MTLLVSINNNKDINHPYSPLICYFRSRVIDFLYRINSGPFDFVYRIHYKIVVLIFQKEKFV